ncbi:hypothetical protein EGR_05789 [Echinococcus granulosus]|uniref:Uncharacterized protein n=1 Tax=Echinococcus granulosus TaxID=6210 RepID=W6UDB0_ECHGR|nr:hypothetical protein EGR_05789 [Echinococcus granulosus]EUB59305.1 hypothetical protein EGR_05789 [Echinococcus granulosus]
MNIAFFSSFLRLVEDMIVDQFFLRHFTSSPLAFFHGSVVCILASKRFQSVLLHLSFTHLGHLDHICSSLLHVNHYSLWKFLSIKLFDLAVSTLCVHYFMSQGKICPHINLNQVEADLPFLLVFGVSCNIVPRNYLLAARFMRIFYFVWNEFGLKNFLLHFSKQGGMRLYSKCAWRYGKILLNPNRKGFQQYSLVAQCWILFWAWATYAEHAITKSKENGCTNTIVIKKIYDMYFK